MWNMRGTDRKPCFPTNWHFQVKSEEMNPVEIQILKTEEGMERKCERNEDMQLMLPLFKLRL